MSHILPSPSRVTHVLDQSPPLVTIGIPTFNRMQKLERAVRSAQNQNHANLEIVISDNASDDGTEQFCKLLADTDPRIRYIRQPLNRGLTENFRAVLQAARGEYFMWLSDDDWIGSGFVSSCLATLRSTPSAVLTSPRVLYWQDDIEVGFERPRGFNLPSPYRRVLSHFATVRHNSVLYGLGVTSAFRRVALHDLLGSDWLLVGGLCALGTIPATAGAEIHRSLKGRSADLSELAQMYRLSETWARRPHTYITYAVFREIAGTPRVYPGSGVRRVGLGVVCALVIGFRYALPAEVNMLRVRLGLRTRLKRMVLRSKAAVRDV